MTTTGPDRLAVDVPTPEPVLATAGRPGARRRAPSAYFWMLLPAVVVLAALTAYPLLRTVHLSFTDTGPGGSSQWVGLENYRRLVGDDRFAESAGLSLAFIAAGIAIQLLLAWALALLLAQRVSRWSNVLRTLFTIPMMLSPVVIGITWRALFNPQFGWINAVLGTPGQDWTGNPGRALGVLVLVDVWQWTPFLFLLISSGLMSIPHDVKEAARLDGAGSVAIFRYVTWPMMLPVTLVAVLLRAIDATKTFELPFTLTSGGPGSATTTVAIFLYRRAFSEFDLGYASSLAVCVLLALVAFALAYLWMMRRVRERYT